MDRKIGKTLLIILTLVSSLFVSARPPKLQLMDTHGRQGASVVAGRPFRLVLDIEDEEEFQPSLACPEGCNITNIIKQKKYFFGVKKKEITRYVFELICNKKGRMVFGPVTLKGKKSSLMSGTIEVDVKAPKAKVDQEAPIFLRVVSRKEDVYVGEKVPFELSLYSRSPFAQNFTLYSPPETSAFRVLDISDLERSKQQDAYKVYKANVNIVPQISGEIFVTPFIVKFLDVSHSFGIIGEYSLRSNEIQLNVHPLPPFEGEVDSVGQFSLFSVKADRTAISLDQALSLKFVLKGRADFASISRLRLNLPENIKCFESASRVIKEGEQEAKYFEYVLQPKEVGEIEVPSQEFVYFDPEDKKFKSLRTQPVTITITEASHVIEDRTAADEKLASQSSESEEDNSVAAFGNLPVYSHPRPWLPRWSMLIIFLGIILWGLGPYIITGVTRFLIVPCKYYSAFSWARFAVNTAKKNKDPENLLEIFRRLFAVRLGVLSSLITQEHTVQMLSLRKMPSDMCSKWEAFFSKISEAHFSPKKVNNNELYDNAYFWINKLKAYL